jgi:hypothetical protein
MKSPPKDVHTLPMVAPLGLPAFKIPPSAAPVRNNAGATCAQHRRRQARKIGVVGRIAPACRSGPLSTVAVIEAAESDP